MDQQQDHSSARHEFGPFQIDLAQRRLTQAGKTVELSSRAFDILVCLIESRDRVVSRNELVARVWAGMVVEEHNLSVQMSALRRALADTDAERRLIATIPRRGYRFVAPLHAPALLSGGPPATAESAAKPALPGQRRTAGIFILVTVVVASAFFIVIHQFWPHNAPPLAIVVLPFRNVSGDAAKNYLADAVTDDVTTALSRVPGSLVIARETADTYRAKSLSAQSIGRALNVSYLLEGSVRADGGTVSLNAQLIDTATGDHVWASLFDASGRTLLEAERNLIAHVGNTLDIVLTDSGADKVRRQRPLSQGAQDLYLQARSILDHSDALEQENRAQRLLERAITVEPDYVAATAALGWLLVKKVQTYEYPDYRKDFEEADNVIAHGVAVAPDNPAIMAVHGRLLAAHERCYDALAAFHSALSAEPNNILALSGVAICGYQTARADDALSALDRLLKIDPDSPATARRYQMAGLLALFKGDATNAVELLLRAVGRSPDKPADETDFSPDEIGRAYLIAAFAMQGDLNEAKRRYAIYAKLWPHRSVWRSMILFTLPLRHLPGAERIGHCLAAAGMPEFADEHEDDSIPPTSTPLSGAGFVPTPLAIPGAKAIDTAELAHRVAMATKPVIVDVGWRAAVIPGALRLTDAEAFYDRVHLDRSAYGRQIEAGESGAGIVVMGNGAFGAFPYNVALHFLAIGFRNVYWYRGGEEAWARAKLPSSEDQ